jgi:hypothetical protein
MLYDVADHPLLSEEAAQLGSLELGAQARMAETLLGLLAFTAFDPITDQDKYDRATDAVALQVSYQVAAGIEAFLSILDRRGLRIRHYRGRGRMPPVHSAAKKIISAIRPATIISGR